MLVLSRKKNEEVVIADMIVIRVIEIRGDNVRLGFEVPRDIPVHRREVYDAIQRENTIVLSQMHDGGKDNREELGEGTMGNNSPNDVDHDHGPISDALES